ncbi:hypothetical protein ACFYQA_35315 [Streptomyces sp. NPDC005774]|uniref:hypothetical protein n=1 Tax=Streptomyces sp. NPDC005774 TaxID=3364728 RepID=UPI00368DC28B
MRARAVSTAAMLASPGSIPHQRRSRRHCPEEEWRAYVQGQDGNRQYQLMKLRFRRQFVGRWPKLSGRFGTPLVERVGRLHGESYHRPAYPVSFRARTYLVYLGLRGYTTFDYPWLFAPGQLAIIEPAAALGIGLGAKQLVDDAINLGFNPNSARQAMHWSVSRIALHTGIFDVTAITEDHIAEALQAIRFFADHPDLERFYPSRQRYLGGAAKNWITHLHQLQVVLYHRGQVATEPRKLMPSWKPPLVLPPQMQAVAEKWLAARRLTDRPSTVDKLEFAIRRFGDWLGEHHPGRAGLVRDQVPVTAHRRPARHHVLWRPLPAHKRSPLRRLLVRPNEPAGHEATGGQKGAAATLHRGSETGHRGQHQRLLPEGGRHGVRGQGRSPQGQVVAPASGRTHIPARHPGQ